MIDYIYAAYIYCLLTAAVIFFQFGLALGLPWGEMAMGGKFSGRYPLRMRVAALVMIVVLTFVALIVLTRSRLVLESYYDFSEYAIWGVVVFSALGVMVNLITPSKKERALWGPVAVILFICVIYVALS